MTCAAVAARLAARPAWQRLGLAFGAGALAGLGQVPFSALPVSLFGFAAMLWLVAAARGWRRAAAAGWWAGFGYFLVTLHWIVEPFFVDAARHGWMAPFGIGFLTGGLALFWAAASGLARWLVPAGGWRRALAWAAAMALAEWLRGNVLSGFPWSLPAYIWSEGPGLQLSALTGPYGLTLITLLLVALATSLAMRRIWLAVPALLAVWLIPLGAGALLVRPDPIPGDAPVLRLVQPNAPQRLKWDPDYAPIFFRRQLEATVAPGDPALVIWPETTIPWRMEEGEPAIDEIARLANGRPVLLGGVRLDGIHAYNAAAVVGPGGRFLARYDKHHTVPFGEYIPLGAVTKYVGLPSYGRRDGYGFSSGPGPALMDLGDLGQALPLICYEAIFPRDVNGAPGRADWMVQLTNDAWFGTFSGPQQHLAQARFRAVEQGLALVRVANTGISAVIDPGGRITGSLGLGEQGFVDLPLPPARAPTLYARTGDNPWVAISILLLLALFMLRRHETD